MLSLIKSRLDGRRDAEEGFTLIELMVVVLIIAILIAIAIPTFLGARQKAQDRAAQSDLRNALTAAKTGYVDTEDYTTVGLSSIEPSLTYVTGAGNFSTQPKTISVNAVSASEIILAAKSASGQCFYIQDLTDANGATPAGTYYGKQAAPANGCNGADAVAFAATW